MDKELYFVCADNVNVNGNFHNFIFTIKYTKLYVPVVTLAARDNKKLSKLLSKGFERSVCWNEFKRKGEDKNRTIKYRYFSNQTLLELIDYLF